MRKYLISLALIAAAACTYTIPPMVLRGTIHQKADGAYEVAVLEVAPAAPATDAGTTLDTGAPPTPTQSRLGFNMTAPYDGAEFGFGNKARKAGTWQSAAPFGWVDGRSLPLDARGELAGQLASDQDAVMLAPHHGLGEAMTITWTGAGTMNVSGTSCTSSPCVVQPPANDANLNIRALDGPITNLNIRRAGSPTGVWDATFLESLQGVGVVRFMQWTRTNDFGSSDFPLPADGVWRWNMRQDPDWLSQAGRVAFEHQIDLANRLGADLWLNIPDVADADYARQLGALVAARLDSNLKIYVEWSNEVWNGAFRQNKRILAQVGGDHVGGWQLYAINSLLAQQAFEDGCSCRARTVRVINAQNGYTHQHNTMFDAVPPASFDALAVAPYVGWIPADPDAVITGGLDGIFTHLTDELDNVVIPEMQRSAANAAARGARLVAYEGGQHVVMSPSHHSHPRFVEYDALLASAQADPRMEALYTRLLAAWPGDAFVHYTLTSSYGRWGYWGAMSRNDRLTDLKYRALRSW